VRLSAVRPALLHAAWADQALELNQRLGAGIQRIPVNDLWTLSVKVQPLADQRMIGGRFLAF